LILALLICVPGLAFSLSTVVTLDLVDGDATEAGPGTGSFDVVRSNNGNVADKITVLLGFSGTAGNGPDYTFSNVNCCFSVEIPEGELSKTVTITPVFDNIVEGTETVIITVLANTEYELGSNTKVEINIADDAAVVTLEKGDSEAAEAGQETGSFTVFRSNNGNVAASISVPLELDGTATHIIDYSLSNVNNDHIVVIPADMLSTIVILTPVFDNDEEGDEIAEISLGTGDSFLVGEPSKTSITIADSSEGGIFKDSFEN